jgi:Xaa-Pro dipeptidase
MENHFLDAANLNNETKIFQMDKIKIQNQNLNFYDTVELTGLPNSFFTKNRKNYFDNLTKLFPEIEQNSIIILQSGDDIPRNDTDVNNYHFQQESNFYYLTGVIDPKFYLILDYTNKSWTLFYEVNHNVRMNIFMKLPKLDELEKRYETNVKDIKNMAEEIKNRNPDKIYFLKGINSDSGTPIQSADINSILGDSIDYKNLREKYDYNELIYEILAETRTIKTSEEIEYLKHVCKATVEAHKIAIKNIKNGTYERDVESDFMCYLRTYQYARSLSYQPICGCGPNSKTLHYQKNDEKLQNGNLLLLDMGIKLGGYCSDVTSTVPVNGKYTIKQKEIYDLVLKANREVINNLKPGIRWPDMHLLAESIILKGLIDLNILNKNFSIENMLEDRVAYYFMPHGLGHFMGLEVHDVGGYLSFTPKRSEKIGLRSLRTSRILLEGNCITVEPGIYFISFLLEKGLADEKINKYFNENILRTYFDFGGVRIEDDILIIENGCYNMSGNLPRTTEEIEKLMASS